MWEVSDLMLQAAARILPPRPPRPYKNGGSSSEASNSYSVSSFSSNPRWVFTNSLPPPEWVEPFNDVSDVVSNRQNFDPFPWVAQILNLLDGSPTMEANLDSYCRTFLIKLSPNFVSYVLKSVELRGKLETALRSFLGLLKEMNFLVTSLASNSLITSFGCLGMVDELLWVWCRMKENGIEPSLYAYNFLLNGLVNSMFIESAERVFEVMEGGKIAPDIATYNTMIKGYRKGGKTQKAMEKFRAMEGRNVEPDKITYMALIQGCYSEGDVASCCGKTDEALALFKKMEEEGCDQMGPAKVARACKILDELPPMGVIPETAFEDMINVLSKAGRVKEACNLANGIVDTGRETPGRIRTVLINALRKAGTADLAMKLMHSKIGIGYDRMGSLKRSGVPNSLLQLSLSKSVFLRNFV
ncbi:hypothetical protein ACFX15_044691 [Malus domestica]